MKILDSNLWVKGTLKTNQTAVELLEAVEDGQIMTAMNEYILAETLAAFDRVLTGHQHDQVLTAFLRRLHTMEGLREVPSGKPNDPPTSRRSSIPSAIAPRSLCSHRCVTSNRKTCRSWSTHTNSTRTSPACSRTMQPSQPSRQPSTISPRSRCSTLNDSLGEPLPEGVSQTPRSHCRCVRPRWWADRQRRSA